MIHYARAAKAKRRYFATCSCGWATPGGMSKPDAEVAARAHSDEPDPQPVDKTEPTFTILGKAPFK